MVETSCDVYFLRIYYNENCFVNSQNTDINGNCVYLKMLLIGRHSIYLAPMMKSKKIEF